MVSTQKAGVYLLVKTESCARTTAQMSECGEYWCQLHPFEESTLHPLLKCCGINISPTTHRNYCRVKPLNPHHRFICQRSAIVAIYLH